MAVWDMTTDIGAPAFRLLVGGPDGRRSATSASAPAAIPSREVALLRRHDRGRPSAHHLYRGIARGHPIRRLSGGDAQRGKCPRARSHAAGRAAPRLRLCRLLRLRNIRRRSRLAARPPARRRNSTGHRGRSDPARVRHSGRARRGAGLGGFRPPLGLFAGRARSKRHRR